jgi:hypothetical protein
MIVIATRDDLRDEFAMADEAFALSPISARATLPSEEDYDAISEAFMETSRGRWFLGEYAKRNRNADTRMVLDAVARIEENLAAQRPPAADNGLAEALAAIRSAVDEARAKAAEAINGHAVEENLAPVRKGARIIREIAWRWREIGADGRICDLLDSQASAIEGACGQIASNAPLGALRAAFDLIEARIAGFGDSGAAMPRAAEEAGPSPSPASSDETPAAAMETAHMATATVNADTDAAISSPATSIESVVATAEAVEMTAEAAAVSAGAADATAEVEEISAEAAEAQDQAHDEAVLDLIALEMAAPDPSDLDDIPDTEADEIHAAELPPAEPMMVAQQPEPILAPVPPAAIEPSLQPSIQPSLGSSLIASGIVRRPVTSGSDPLAPIRRMSQAEKIAFFS